MKKTLIIAIASISSVIAISQSKSWKLDKSHSSINFAVDHLLISETKGQFKDYTISTTATKPDFTDAQIDITIQAASINTEDESRDGHLKSADFFDVEKYPTITFKGKSFKKVKGNFYKLNGDLTMHGVTKPVTLDAQFKGIVKTPFGDTRAGVNVYGEIDRYAHGLKWNKAMETGGLAVGQKVRLAASVELIQQ
jgi:polyisoprenoid-binding protein YceI